MTDTERPSQSKLFTFPGSIEDEHAMLTKAILKLLEDEHHLFQQQVSPEVSGCIHRVIEKSNKKTIQDLHTNVNLLTNNDCVIVKQGNPSVLLYDKNFLDEFSEHL